MPLIFVPTPLGNLRDVTLRALDVLRDAELIVAEDTRVARKLLHALGAARPRNVELPRAERRRGNGGHPRAGEQGGRRGHVRRRNAGHLRSGELADRGGPGGWRGDRGRAGAKRRHGRRGALRLSAAALHVRGLSAAGRDGATRTLRAARCAGRSRRSGTSRRGACPRRLPISRSSRRTRRFSSCANTPSCTNSISGARRSE